MKIRYVRVNQRPVACLVGGYHDGEPFVAKSVCSPKDNFCRRIGRDIAIGRFQHKRLSQGCRKYRSVLNQEVNNFMQYLKDKQREHSYV